MQEDLVPENPNDAELERAASDPSTPQAALADLAYDHPEVRVAIARNPATYDGLLEWLGELDDPDVNAALLGRRDGVVGETISDPPAVTLPPAATLPLAALSTGPLPTSTLPGDSAAGKFRRPAFLTTRIAIVTAGLLVVAIVATVLISVVGHASNAVAATASESVSAGSTAVLRTSGVTVTLNPKSVSGSGTLSVSPTTMASGVQGVAIRLTGAKLVGTAKLTFPQRQSKGEPAPLVGYAESKSAPIRLVGGVTVTATGASVVTAHLSNWFSRSWSSTLAWAVAALDKQFSARASAATPTCAGDAAVRTAGATATGSPGTQVTWCMGQDASGVPQLTVTNAREYIASAQQDGGLTLSNPDPLYGVLIPSLFPILAPPAGADGQKTQLIGGGDHYTYSVTGFQSQAVQVVSSGAANMATSLVFGAQTLDGLSPLLPKDTPHGTTEILKALGAIKCLANLKDMASVTVTSANEGASNLKISIAAVYGCLSEVIETQFGKNAVLSRDLAGGFPWLTSGVDAALDRLAASADSTLNPKAYTVTAEKPVGLGFVADDPTLYNGLNDWGDNIDLRSPSGNIHCGVDLPTNYTGFAVGCYLDHYTYTPPQPNPCNSDDGFGGAAYGGVWSLSANGAPSADCYQGLEFGGGDNTARILPYGHSLTYDGYIFTSESTGMSIIDVSSGHGVKLNLSSWTEF
jgi:hypothetical protein